MADNVSEGSSISSSRSSLDNREEVVLRKSLGEPIRSHKNEAIRTEAPKELSKTAHEEVDHGKGSSKESKDKNGRIKSLGVPADTFENKAGSSRNVTGTSKTTKDGGRRFDSSGGSSQPMKSLGAKSDANNGEDDNGKESGSAWQNLRQNFVRLFPYMWPYGRPVLQAQLIFCFVLLIGVRIINVFVPIFFKRIVDALLAGTVWPWELVTTWGVLRLLQGGGSWSMGILNNLRLFLWISVKQHNIHNLQTSLLRHIQNLSIRWHQSSRTGKTTRMMDRGVRAVSKLVEYILFSIVPTIIDIITAIIFFVLQFNVYFGLIMLASMILYFACTFLITEWRTKYRRDMNEYDNKQRAMGVDSLINAETVKYHSMEDYEVKRYGKAVKDFQEMEWKSDASLQLLNLLQTIIINTGLFGVALYSAYLVYKQELTVGDFSLAVTYFKQLMTPLNFLGTVYRLIQESFINTEHMLDLLAEEIEVKDKPDAVTYKQTNMPPEIEFRHLTFYYDEAYTILKDVSFKIPAGTSAAVVGASGFGKSTLSKLVFRLYDPVEGSVLVNGRDIRDYTQRSYRSTIGMVPQDVVLFNDTIMYNIAYGKLDATETEIREAAIMADIHSTVEKLPEGYDTIVGERGIKLSGGEKQRIAIARALLKNPNVIIFDEATSSLDTETEMHIQVAIENAARQRTVMIIAHRLSTIIFCDQILVLDSGRIVEQGRHEDLLLLDGKYARLWNIQANALASDTEANEYEEDED